MKKFWNFQEKNKDEPVEFRLDGNIVDDDDTWIYEWLGMACASPNAFRTQLEGYAGRDISVWIFFWFTIMIIGGSVLCIHNRQLSYMNYNRHLLYQIHKTL